MRRKQLTAAIISAALIIAAALTLNYLVSLGYIDGELARRLKGLMVGLILVVSGNFIPKMLEPLSHACCEPSKEQSLRRLAGWSFVLTGIAYSIIWLVTPLEVASILSKSVVGACVLLVMVPFAWSFVTRKRVQPPAEL